MTGLIIKSNARIKRKSGKNLFLLEIIIVMLFFSLSAAVIVQLFAGSYAKSRDSRCLVKAVTEASSFAEIYRASGGDMAKAAQLLGVGDIQEYERYGGTGTTSVYTAAFDSNFNEVILLATDSLDYLDYSDAVDSAEANVAYTITAESHTGVSVGGQVDLGETAAEKADGLEYCTVTVMKGADVIFEITTTAVE
ncbi:hypothetical protein FACS1894120_3360 [Clostridia bacterium]|nr:hypothetical protein FACS1894120_3360 [Clostridia bacterium]